jgi:hypothetical protein
MTEKSTISFVRTLVLYLVFRNSKLPLTMPLMLLCNCKRFVAEVRMMGGGLPAWFVVPWCSPRLVYSFVPSSFICSQRRKKVSCR